MKVIAVAVATAVKMTIAVQVLSYFNNSIIVSDIDNRKINDHDKNDMRGTSTENDLLIVD